MPNEDAILNKSYEGSERDEDLEDIDESREDTSRVYNQLEYNKYSELKEEEIYNEEVRSKIKSYNNHQSSNNNRNFIKDNMNNIKEYRQAKALNDQDEIRFKEMLGEIEQEKEILNGINTLDALME